MNHHHRPAGNERAGTLMALLASMATALAGILTLVLGPAPADTTTQPPTLAALSVATPWPTTTETERPRTKWRPRPQPICGHIQPVTDTNRMTVATSGRPANRQVITRERAAKLVRRVAPSIVNITVQQSDGTTSAGTGIVLRSDGLVITNAHVVARAAAVKARSLANQRTYRASILAADETHDVAVIQLRGAHNLPAGRFAPSTRLRPGDPVASIGNAWGRDGRPTINTGPITRLGVRIASTTRPPAPGPDSDLEQAAHLNTSGTDTSQPGPPLSGLIEARNHIQPGESGGPMINKNGLIVGLNVAYSGHNGHPTGYGYAIPSKQALAIAASMVRYGT